MRLLQAGDEPRHRDRPGADAERLRARVLEVDDDLLELAERLRRDGEEAVEDDRHARSGRATRRNPPPAGPVSGPSTTAATNAAARQASTAFPPAASTSAPALADSGWPAAIAPRAYAVSSVRPRGHRESVLGSDAAYRPPRAQSWRRKLGSSVPFCDSADELRSNDAPAARRRVPPRPVATTVTHTWPVSRESTVAPKMMFVSSVAVCAHDLGRLVDLDEREVVPARDREQDPARADDLGVDERRAERPLGGVARPRRTGRVADAHQRGAGVLHHRAHVGEVEVDEARRRDQVADALDALPEDVVGDLEGVDHRRRAVEHLEQAVVRDDDDGVAGGAQLLDAALGGGPAARALEAERRRDDARR